MAAARSWLEPGSRPVQLAVPGASAVRLLAICRDGAVLGERALLLPAPPFNAHGARRHGPRAGSEVLPPPWCSHDETFFVYGADPGSTHR